MLQIEPPIQETSKLKKRSTPGAKRSQTYASKFNHATVLVLKHVDALINLDMYQFLKSDPIKRLGLETKYLPQIKSDLMNMQGNDPGWRKYLQNFNCSVGSLEQTAKRDTADQIILYGPAKPPVYPARPLATADCMPVGR
eukprot:gene34721-44906_t